ncbi:MAG: YbaN family protein [Thiomicrorhabdus sp.]|nr:YbaN family protein [Thiomicrorhabdus sp.]
MKQHIKRWFLFMMGGLFFSLGLIGVLLPILPTTPFMILAAACFASSSPRFHQALLHNRWFGDDLRRWEATRTMKRQTKKRATVVIVLSFSISIAVLWGSVFLQALLLGIALVLLFLLWHIAEERST